MSVYERFIQAREQVRVLHDCGCQLERVGYEEVRRADILDACEDIVTALWPVWYATTDDELDRAWGRLVWQLGEVRAWAAEGVEVSA